MTRTKDPLDQWAHAGSREIDLPSGAGKATIRTLDIIDLVPAGGIPNELRGIALKAEGGEFNPSEASDEDLQAWVDLKATCVAMAVEKFHGKEVSITAEWVKEQMPKEDRDRIFAAATHVLLPKQMQGLAAMSSFRDVVERLVTPENSGGNGKGAE